MTFRSSLYLLSPKAKRRIGVRATIYLNKSPAHAGPRLRWSRRRPGSLASTCPTARNTSFNAAMTASPALRRAYARAVTAQKSPPLAQRLRAKPNREARGRNCLRNFLAFRKRTVANCSKGSTAASVLPRNLSSGSCRPRAAVDVSALQRAARATSADGPELAPTSAKRSRFETPCRRRLRQRPRW